MDSDFKELKNEYIEIMSKHADGFKYLDDIINEDDEKGNKKGMSLNKDGELHVDASIYSANNLISSDIRLKKNILPLNNAILTINKLNPVSYNKKTDVKSSEYNISENGFIAQEIQKVLPNLVHESNDKEKMLYKPKQLMKYKPG